MKEYNADVCLKINASLGEGPLWDTEDNTLLWVNILENKLFRFNPKTGENKTVLTAPHVSTVVKKESGGLVVTCRDGFYTYDEKSETLTAITLPEKDNESVRFNDGKCDPAGRLWAGTMAYDTATGTGKLYCLDTNAELTTKLPAVTISNGLAWDDNKMYYIDSITRDIHIYDYELSSGNISNQRSLFKVNEDGGLPDGCCLDNEGHLWVAFWGESMVRRISPNGEEVARVHIKGASQVTACAIGGDNMDTLFITTAAVEKDLNEEKNAGNLFSVKIDAKAAPIYSFKN